MQYSTDILVILDQMNAKKLVSSSSMDVGPLLMREHVKSKDLSERHQNREIRALNSSTGHDSILAWESIPAKKNMQGKDFPEEHQSVQNHALISRAGQHFTRHLEAFPPRPHLFPSNQTK